MHDVRLAPAAVASWLGALIAVSSPTVASFVATAIGAAFALVIALRAKSGLSRLLAMSLLVGCFVTAIAAARSLAVSSGVVAELAEERAVVSLNAVVRSDPVSIARHRTVMDITAHTASARGETFEVRAPLTVFGQHTGGELQVGERIVVLGRLAPDDDPKTAATLTATSLRATGESSWWWTAAGRVRDGVVESVARAPDQSAALIPALVQGDDRGLEESTKEEFRRSGLTHLLAVSGTNLSIVLVTVLLIGKSCGVRGRWQWLLGGLSVVGFILLARPEPSVLRAAAMGSVALAALGFGQRSGIRALSSAVIVLLLIDPWLARSVGFALSVCATTGILLLAPRWSRSLGVWLPRWCAIAIAVPAAAQIACIPIVAAISGSVSLVGVFANLAAGPAVAPATVLGLLGGLVALLSPSVAHVIGLLAGLCAQWIIGVADFASSLSGASVPWGQPIWLLTVVCVLIAATMSRLLARPWLIGGLALALVVGFVHPPHRGWPATGWVMVACDVGQGDATVLNAGGGAAVVVDAGPEPRLIDGCLDRLGVTVIPLLIFTHDHADHTDGWPGVVEDRRVHQVATGPTGGPSVGDRSSSVLVTGQSIDVGRLHLEILAPRAGFAVRGADGTAINNASVVLSVHTRGVSILLTGDIEPLAQHRLLRRTPDLSVDVLKVPHHGSGRQDQQFIEQVDARFGSISVGRDNDYGHPAKRTLQMLRSAGTKPLRTDLRGDLAFVSRDGKLWAQTR